jgi:hypothetical protein
MEREEKEGPLWLLSFLVFRKCEIPQLVEFFLLECIFQAWCALVFGIGY